MPEMLKRGGPGIRRRQPEQSPRRTRRQTAVALAGVPLFAGFKARHLNKLAAETDELSFEPGQSIVMEGEPGETLFVVLTGQAKVTRGGKRVGRVLPGDFFGELSAIDGGPRSASIVAETPMEVLRLFRRTLTRMIEEEPQVALTLLDGIVRRFREINRAAALRA
jgi:CRP/FNR family transcriptional regulator, cyclic AMP receptor protein